MNHLTNFALSITLLLALIAAQASAQPQPVAQIHAGDILNCAPLIHYVRPIYPRQAKIRHLQGMVKLRATISTSGELRAIEILTGDPTFVPAALNAVRKWRYRPCLLNGTAVEAIIAIDLPFTLNQ